MMMSPMAMHLVPPVKSMTYRRMMDNGAVFAQYRRWQMGVLMGHMSLLEDLGIMIREKIRK